MPRIETRYFHAIDNVERATLILDDDLLSLTTVTNGDAAVVASNERTTVPRNSTPYYYIRILDSASKVWTYTTNPDDAITVLGIWGYHPDYANAWETLTTSTVALSNTDTAATFAAAVGDPGMLLKIDSEFVYLSARTTTAATLVRAVNGSTAATHTNTATVSAWIPDRRVSGLAISATAAFCRIREQSMNPTPEITIIDGRSFQTVKDVRQYIREQIRDLGLAI